MIILAIFAYTFIDDAHKAEAGWLVIALIGLEVLKFVLAVLARTWADIKRPFGGGRPRRRARRSRPYPLFPQRRGPYVKW